MKEDKAVAAAVSAASAPPLSPINGAVEITVTLRTGAQEKVKVRQLPIRLLNEWSAAMVDESRLVELYCDKVDRERDAKILKLSGEALSLLRLQQNSTDHAELEKLSNELAMTRAEISQLNENRWDDDLTPESHDEIVRIGYELNRPRFDRWLSNRSNAIGHLKETYRRFLPEHPLLETGKATPGGKPNGSPDSSTTSPSLQESSQPK